MIKSFISLTCGSISGTDSFAEILTHLKRNLTTVLEEIVKLPSESDERVTLFGPLLGRSVLELSFTCIIGRLDPFRLLTLREFQMQASSSGGDSLGSRSASAFQWNGDVKPSEKEPEKLWEGDRSMSKVARSLLGNTYGDIFWKPAFNETLDAITDTHSGPWITEIQGIEPDSFVVRTRTDCDRTYSTLSKGIHYEFIIPPGAIYDKTSVIVFVKDAIRLASRLALLSHATSTCQGKLALADALQSFTTAQQFESLA